LQIGRTRTSQIHIKGDVAVSQKHAVISWRDEQWDIEDMDSSNGTCINGIEIFVGQGPSPLNDGDILTIGTDTIATVKIVKAGAQAEVSPPKPKPGRKARVVTKAAAESAAVADAAATAAAEAAAADKAEEEERSARLEAAKRTKAAKTKRAKEVDEKEAKERAIASEAEKVQDEELQVQEVDMQEQEKTVQAQEANTQEEEAQMQEESAQEENMQQTAEEANAGEAEEEAKGAAEMNVEQYLSVTCDALAEQVRVQVSDDIAQLRRDMTQVKAELTAACT